MTATRPTWPAWMRRAVRDAVITPDTADTLANTYLHHRAAHPDSSQPRRPRTRTIGSTIGYTIGALITITITASIITLVALAITAAWRYILGA